MQDLADNNFEFEENEGKFSKRVDNIVGKREIARFKRFLFLNKLVRNTNVNTFFFCFFFRKKGQIGCDISCYAVFCLYRVSVQLISRFLAVTSAPIHASPEFLLRMSCTAFFPRHCLLFPPHNFPLTLSQTSPGFYVSAVQTF